MTVTLTITSLVFLALMFGQYDCDRSPRRCAIISRVCAGTFQNMNLDMNNPDIDASCLASNEIKTCLGDCLYFMMQSPIERATVKVLEYACEPSRRQLVTELSQAQCFHDGSLEARIEGRANECATTAIAGLDHAVIQAFHTGNPEANGQLCPVIQSMMECINEEVSKMCGQSIVPVFQDMFLIFMKEILEDNVASCIDQIGISHEVVRRAVDALIANKNRK